MQNVKRDKAKCVQCGGEVYRAQELCKRHYDMRRYFAKNGPRKSTERGSLAKWVDDHKDYANEDCLIWPFKLGPHGYGFVRYNGKSQRTHRVMCEIANGAPPLGKNQALHSCGNGHLGCVNPKHLRWGDTFDNMRDREEHGNTPAGESHPFSRLSKSDVKDIRRRVAEGERQRDIANHYAVHPSHVSKIASGKKWNHP